MPQSNPLSLVSSTAVLATALPFRSGAAADLPQRVKILNWGLNIGRTTKARILVDDIVAATLSANQDAVAVDRVPLDYEHQSHKAHPNYVPDPRHSPGGGRIEVVPGDGVYLSGIEYTPNGVEFAGSYADVSAVAHLDADGRPLWISSVALTQRGDLAGMEFAEHVAALSALSPASQTSYRTMETNKETTYREALIKLLSLKPDESGTVSEEALAAAIAAMGEKAPQPAKPEDTEEAESVAMSARLDRIERSQLIERASREGKVVPLSAEEIEKTPVAVLSSMIARLAPGEIPLGNAQKSTERPGEKVVALSADEASAARQLGLTAEEYRAANPA